MNKITILLLMIGSAVLVLSLGRYSSTQVSSDMPWSVEQLTDGSTHVLGVTLGKTRLQDSLHAFPSDAQIQLLIGPTQTLKLVTLFKEVNVGGLIADIQLGYDIPQARLQKLLPSASRLGSLQTIRLKPEQLSELQDAKLVSLSYYPSIDYDEDMLLQRFGYPDKKEDVSDRLQRWTYKGIHLQIYLDATGADKLVYTAKPKD